MNKSPGKVCIWCMNRTVDVCASRCQPEGKYRYLAPEPLESWEPGPLLPPFRELVELPAAERLALVYLSLYYHSQRRP